MNTSIQRPQRICHYYYLPTLQCLDLVPQIDVYSFQHRNLLLFCLQFDIHISDHSPQTHFHLLQCCPQTIFRFHQLHPQLE